MAEKTDRPERHNVTFDLENQASGPHTPETTDEKEKRNPVQSIIATHIERICKAVAVLIVLVAFIVHLVRVLGSGSDTCDMMFSSGWWRGDMWQPYGCMMHKYIPSEVRICLQNQPVAVVGDSRSRGLYFDLVKTLYPEYSTEGKPHHNMHYKEGNITIKFFWQANPDKSMEKLLKQWIKDPKQRPQLIITGLSAWTIKNQGLKAALAYEKNLTRIKESIEVLSKINYKPKVKPPAIPLKPPFPESPVVLWMAQEPVVYSQLSEARKSITNKKINVFNKIADHIFSNSSVKLIHATRLVAQGHPKATLDGLHYGPPVSTVELNFILNFYCNDYMQVPDATCCFDTPRITRLQYNAIAVFVTCIVLSVVMLICRWLWPAEHDGPAGVEPTTPGGHASSSLRWVYSDQMYPVMRNVAVLGIIMFYFYMCDRTNLFMKEHKQYSNWVFAVSMLAFLGLGASTWSPAEQVNVVNREQSEEWRGWMQLVILLYHYTGASKKLPIYVFIRLLVASYLFLSGYGHFTFFWKKGEYSLYRFCHVMTRMNLFVVVLCLVMGRPYQFYYFVPLVSFWFVVVYFTMAVFPRVTAASVRDDPKQYIFIWLKFFVLFGVIYVVWTSPVLCDWLFSQWAIKELFIDENDRVREWRFRSWLDRYIALYGMVFAFAYNTAKETRVIDDTLKKRLFNPTHTTVTLVLSALALGVYAIQAFTCSSKPSCNATHSIASCVPVVVVFSRINFCLYIVNVGAIPLVLPILMSSFIYTKQITAFILLRNIPTFLRIRFSRFFAWVGSISLELFIGQYHIWLAKDTKGILVLIPGQPVLNVIVTTFVFVCVCHEVHKVSGELTKALISKDITTMIRRLIIFVIALIIIAWHKTHHTSRPRLV